MKLEAWLSAVCMASAASAVTGPSVPGKPARPPGKPEKMADWKWSNPFASDRLGRYYDAACEAEQTFHASEFLLDDLSEPPPLGLEPFLDALKKVFADRQYPGSWDGIDPHGYDRNLLQMEYVDVPIKVREWIEDQERSEGAGKGLFAVYDKPPDGAKVRSTVKVPDMPIPPELRPIDKKKVVIFAPGALYEVLPLWVAEESKCSDVLLDIAKYSPELADGGVVAYPVNKTKARRGAGKRDVKFTIKAQVLKAKPGVQEEEKEKESAAEGTKSDKDEL